jgi:hypothetical protein
MRSKWVGALAALVVLVGCVMAVVFLPLGRGARAMVVGLAVVAVLWPAFTQLFDDLWNHRDSSHWT